MDRNHLYASSGVDFAVALRKESVDRNTCGGVRQYEKALVALRKESVDRNLVVWAVVRVCEPSLSARRAWIEIPGHGCMRGAVPVALRKESVDRNSPDMNTILSTTGRSPQGERG